MTAIPLKLTKLSSNMYPVFQSSLHSFLYLVEASWTSPLTCT